jgi:hypothetical protein
VFTVHVFTELLRKRAPVNQFLFRISVHQHNLTAYPSASCTQNVNTPLVERLQNSTDGPFCETKETPITGSGGIVPFSEWCSVDGTWEGNAGSEPRSGPAGGTKLSGEWRKPEALNLPGVTKNVAEAKCS